MAPVGDFIAEALRGRAAPFLFVGSGLSRRYTSSDDWEGLLRRFAEATGTPYDYFRASAGGDLPSVASEIAKAFHPIWWTRDEYAESRSTWGSQASGPQSALKVEVARYVASVGDELPGDGPLAQELELLRAVTVDGIITTNFDPLLERLFPDFEVFVGQNELLFSNPQGVGEIYKIHGSHQVPDSLVLTAEDYRTFEERNAYLAAKLLTTFVEHPVVFIGYSLGDRNIRNILKAIARCLTQENINELRDRLIFVQWDPAEHGTASPYPILIDDFVINVLRIAVGEFSELYAALGSIKRAFPARLLRQLKEHVYKLVLEGDAQGSLGVVDIDDSSKATDLEVVFGVGIIDRLDRRGYVGLERWDLIDDVIYENGQFDANRIVSEVLPLILRQPGNVPTFKYLRAAGMLTRKGNIRRSADVDERVIAMADSHRGGNPASGWYKRTSSEHLQGVRSIGELETKGGASEVMKYGTCMAPGLVDVGELRDFLKRNKALRTGQWEGTQYVKLTCFLDWLEFGR